MPKDLAQLHEVSRANPFLDGFDLFRPASCSCHQLSVAPGCVNAKFSLTVGKDVPARMPAGTASIQICCEALEVRCHSEMHSVAEATKAGNSVEIGLISRPPGRFD